MALLNYMFLRSHGAHFMHSVNVELFQKERDCLTKKEVGDVNELVAGEVTSLSIHKAS